MDIKEKFAQRLFCLSDKKLGEVCLKIVDDNIYPDFWKFPASLGHHHAYEGGIAIHTLEVLDYALKSAESFPRADKDIIITACLWHDVAKIYDYKIQRYFTGQETEIPQRHLLKEKGEGWQDCWISTPYHGQIHHINGSCAEFTHHALSQGIERELITKIQHVILAHHGPVKEWGSPVAPQTLESVLVHQADSLSAAYGATK